MKKKIWASLRTRPVLSICLISLAIFLIIAVISNWSTVTSWTNSLLNWATDNELYIPISAVAIFYLGSSIKIFGLSDKHNDFIKNTFWYRASLPISKLVLAFAHKQNSGWNWITRSRLKKIGNSAIWASIVILALNLFPFFNYYGWLRGFNIFFGALVLIAIELFVLGNLPEKLNKKLFISIFYLLILVLTYYLDYFIFGWNKPWFTCAALILAVAILIFIFIKNFKKQRKERRSIEYQKNKERLKAEAAEHTIQEFSKLGMGNILLKYLELKKHKSDQEPAALCLKAYAQVREKEKGMSSKEIKAILKKIPFINFNVDAEFFHFLLATLDQDDYPTILMTNIANPTEDDLPILFRYCNNKKDVLQIIPNLNTDLFYNDIKKEFKIKEFVGLINAITYSYLKEWDDKQWLTITVATIENLIAFAVSCTEKVWSIGQAMKITSALTKIQESYKEKGVQVKFPENFEQIKEKYKEK